MMEEIGFRAKISGPPDKFLQFGLLGACVDRNLNNPPLVVIDTLRDKCFSMAMDFYYLPELPTL